MVTINLSDIQLDYVEWLKNLISNDGKMEYAYSDLLNYLYQYKLNYTELMKIPMDLNRADDGVYLRYRFAKEYGYTNEEIRYGIKENCSMLEFLVALSVKIEENIMTDPVYGNRISDWFWNMITSLGLGTMDDFAFSSMRCDKILKRFEERRYKANGRGGLFTIDNPKCDMTSIEIWRQANTFVNGIDNL